MSEKCTGVKPLNFKPINSRLINLKKIIQLEKWEIKGRKVFNASED
jgi:hypothetical protein